MEKLRKHFIKFIIFLFVATFIPNIIENEINFNENIESDLEVHFIDVGQGDSCLIKFKDEFMLIDSGEGEYSDKVISFLDEKGVSKLKYIVATHPHSDHIGGLKDIIEAFEVENILMPEATSNSKTFENLVKTIKEKEIKVIKALKNNVYTLGEAEFTILSPEDKPYSDLNNVSVVIRLLYKNATFLFTGDIESLVENELINSNSVLNSTVLKVAHHGSDSSSLIDFLEKVNPKVAVISVGEDNSYSHPSQNTIENLLKITEHIYRTDYNGNVSVYTDGEEINVITQK